MVEDDGHLTEDDDDTKFNGTVFRLPLNATLMEVDYIHKCAKLANLYHRLSNEDVEIIENLVKKY